MIWQVRERTNMRNNVLIDVELYWEEGQYDMDYGTPHYLKCDVKFIASVLLRCFLIKCGSMNRNEFDVLSEELDRIADIPNWMFSTLNTTKNTDKFDMNSVKSQACHDTAAKYISDMLEEFVHKYNLEIIYD